MWKNAVNEVIDIIYRTNYKFVCIKGDEGFFSSKAYAGLHSFTASKLKLAVKFFQQNTFVYFSNILFRQVKGIPMVGNCI